ncbi:MAG: hypothetical protein AAFP76_09620 [Bacteroidota bacterium]
MTKGQLKNAHIKVLVVLSLLFLAVSIYFHSIENFVVYRALRGVICFVFLGAAFLLHKHRVHSLVVTFLLLYGGSSIATVWYENSVIATLSMALNFSAFMLLIGALSPKIAFKKMNVLFTAIFIILVLVNAYLLYIFIEMIRDFAHGELHYFMIMLGAMSLVIAGFLALLYNHQLSTKGSLLFTVFVFVLVFAEVFRAIAYYDFAYGNFSVYTARALLLLGVALLIHYDLIHKKTSEVLSRK